MFLDGFQVFSILDYRRGKRFVEKKEFFRKFLKVFFFWNDNIFETMFLRELIRYEN